MLTIYADAFMTATRNEKVRLHEMPPTGVRKRRNLLRPRRVVDVDVTKL